ncbi:hypothetical protein LCR01_02780 [Companilactobacillus crustorum]|uniref:Uncharacterized protein n=1 Tax=Companilactobacillus crustorum TaxID=392416 RepID=A0AB34A9A7_9LACO|nr:hypothetical protein LCR01_02780 [Companilactobacillus crustorum]
MNQLKFTIVSNLGLLLTSLRELSRISLLSQFSLLFWTSVLLFVRCISILNNVMTLGISKTKVLINNTESQSLVGSETSVDPQW